MRWPRNPVPPGELTMWFVVLTLAGGLWAMVHHGPVLVWFPTHGIQVD